MLEATSYGQISADDHRVNFTESAAAPSNLKTAFDQAVSPFCHRASRGSLWLPFADLTAGSGIPGFDVHC
jgi:hypothetical protein